ncbi:FCD domain-containing protein [Pusillimonas sp. TS35]|uniref:GntR family transcriptional regulator n=1 Tax=Paracandidimonas lactea TaxID=2895524 RepID=UPI00136F7082|nr:GntR family transcriptional regulator [Paracandidimonas lactea]MYN11744.1 FCD domain-containing protein [Pusillimonas sp. TS35]
MDENTLDFLRKALTWRPDAGPAGTALFNALYESIIQGRLRPGQGLSEAQLAQHLSISRQLVREAFIKLAERRLLAILPQRGTFVVRVSPARVLEAQWVREAIETRIVGEAARRNDPALVRTLRDLIARQMRVQAEDYPAFQELDDAFHRTLALAVHHGYAWEVIEQSKAQTDRVRYLSLESQTPFELLARQHGRIVDAIEQGDEKAAMAAMGAHLQVILRTLPEIVKRHPDLFEKET